MPPLSPTFPRLQAPGTGRDLIQLTQGKAFCYPLYYFIPSMTEDGRFLIHHRSDGTTVQLHRLDLGTGESVQITNAKAAARYVTWRPWDMPAGDGVMDHRSVLNTRRGEVIYFDDRDVRIVDVANLKDRLLFSLPENRVAIGQNCVSPDGNWLVYIQHDRAIYDKILATEHYDRTLSRGTELRARHFDTGEDRLLVRINSPIHHVLPHSEDQFVFCHPATEDGMLLTNLKGGWYSHLRTQAADGSCVCHYLSTQRGLAYEAPCPGPPHHYLSGLYAPSTHDSHEFALPKDWGYTHTGADPEGRLWFYETQPNYQKTHELIFLERFDGTNTTWKQLVAHWPTYGSGQKSHFHPRLTPDRQWIIMVGGDTSTGTNHIFLLNVSDLHDSIMPW